MRFTYLFAFTFPLALAFGCSSDTNPGGTGGSDTAGSGSAAATGGDTGSGSTTAGGSAGDGGSGSETSGGAGGSGGGEPSDAVPSPGCSVPSSRPTGGTIEGAIYENGSSPRGPSWLIFPEKYDGETPLPVLIGFHGCGGGGDANGTPYYDITRNSGFEDDYIVMAPVSTTPGCFDYGVDMPKAKLLFTELIENYCVDLSRVFGTGHSYGAGGMLMSLTASANAADFEHFGFRGIAPVAGWLIGSQSTVVPTMYIQGITDAERSNGDGAEVVAKIVDVNQCDDTTTDYAVDACDSNHDGDPVNAGCKSYSGCDVPTVWCRHDDSDYGGTFHGIPCFYKQAMFDFFASL